MVADCKSAALRSYGGSNPPLCTRLFFSAMSMQKRKRFYVALAIYAVLALLIWVTMEDVRCLLEMVRSVFGPDVDCAGRVCVRTVLHWRAIRFATSRTRKRRLFRADVAQLVEHSLGKGEVTSNPGHQSRIGTMADVAQLVAECGSRCSNEEAVTSSGFMIRWSSAQIFRFVAFGRTAGNSRSRAGVTQW